MSTKTFTEIVVWLLLVGIIGFIVGWLLRRLFRRGNSQETARAESSTTTTTQKLTEPEFSGAAEPRPPEAGLADAGLADAGLAGAGVAAAGAAHLGHDDEPAVTEALAETPDVAVDAEVPSVEAELPAADAELPSVEAEVPPVDAEVPPVDAEVPPVDAEVPSVGAEVPSVEAELPAADAELPSVEAELPAADAELPTVGGEAPSVEAEVPTVEAEVPSVGAEVPSVEAELPAVDPELPSVGAEVPTVEAEVPTADAEVGALGVTAPSAEAEVPSVEAELPAVDAEVPSVGAELPAVDAEVPSVDAELSSVDAELPAVDAEIPSVEAEAPSIDVEADGDAPEAAVPAATLGAAALAAETPSAAASADVAADSPEILDPEVAGAGTHATTASVLTGYRHGVAPLADGSAPGDAWTIKGNTDSGLYHTPESPYFDRTKAEAWFATEEEAKVDGFRPWNASHEPSAPARLVSAAPVAMLDGYQHAAAPKADGSAPAPEWIVKGNADSGLYHTVASPYYGRTRAEAWFKSEADAEADGFRAWGSDAEEAVEATAAPVATVPAVPLLEGYRHAAAPTEDGSAPGPEWIIKGNADSGLFHTSESPYYKRTKAEAWFKSEADAEADGFRKYR